MMAFSPWRAKVVTVTVTVTATVKVTLTERVVNFGLTSNLALQLLKMCSKYNNLHMQ